MAIFNIPSRYSITKDINGKLLLIREEPHPLYKDNAKMGLYKVFFHRNGKFYTYGEFVTRNRDEVFKNTELQKAKEFKFSWEK